MNSQINTLPAGRGFAPYASYSPHVQRAGAGKEEQSFHAELDAILAGIPSPPKVPAFETITSTTAAEYSYKDWEQAMQNTWQRERLSFSGTARKLAGSQAAHRPVSTKSPTIQPLVPYARRWTLNLIANNYKRDTPLSHISKFMQKGSPFERAQAAESNRILNVADPSGDEMKSQIMDAVLALSADLPEGKTGELVVYFSGHGTNGKIFGVDWKMVSPMKMKSLAEFARDWGVHIVYILDSCRAGGITVLPQADALNEAEAGFSKLPDKQRQIVSKQANAARALGTLAFQMNEKVLAASETVRYIKAYTPANRMKMMKCLHEVSKIAADLRNLLRGGPVLSEDVINLVPDGKLPAGIVPNQAELEKALNNLTSTVLQAYAGGGPQVNRAFRAAAELIGHWNNAINTLVEQINSRTDAAR